MKCRFHYPPLLITRRRSRPDPDPHRCLVCEEEFTPINRPAGELKFMGRWGDACPHCHTYFTEETLPENENTPA